MSTAVGIYDYESQSREELDVQVGCKLSILARDGEWCVVEKGEPYFFTQADKEDKFLQYQSMNWTRQINLMMVKLCSVCMIMLENPGMSFLFKRVTN